MSDHSGLWDRWTFFLRSIVRTSLVRLVNESRWNCCANLSPSRQQKSRTLDAVQSSADNTRCSTGRWRWLLRRGCDVCRTGRALTNRLSCGRGLRMASGCSNLTAAAADVEHGTGRQRSSETLAARRRNIRVVRRLLSHFSWQRSLDLLLY